MHVTLAEVQQWLEPTKLTLGAIDASLEETATAVVFGQVGRSYSAQIPTWVDNTTTPSLIRKAISMFIAAWVYNRAYSEDNGSGNAYAIRLENMAVELLAGILEGTINLQETGIVVGIEGGPLFLPTDTTGSDPQYDAQGFLVGFAGAEDIKFRMGTVF